MTKHKCCMVNDIYILEINLYEVGLNTYFFEVPEGSTVQAVRDYIKDRFSLSTDINDDLCLLGGEKLDNIEDNYSIRFNKIAKGNLLK